MKVCSKCNQNKSVACFYKRASSLDGLKASCIDCCKASRNKTVDKNRDLQRRYGISIEEQETMIFNQSGKCASCGDETKLCVDHDHTTGKVRGLLCQSCNKALGLFKDDITVLNKAIKYLEKHKNDSNTCETQAG
jgi:hypothetical protein